MSDSAAIPAPVMKTSAEIHVAAAPEDVYNLVSDLPRSGEWSEECTGGEWVSGTPGTVGAVFRGHNYRADDVVAWAPVARGDWSTSAEVTTATPARTFRWAMHDSTGEKQQSEWAFDIEPAHGGCVLRHHFVMRTATEGVRSFTSEMTEGDKRRFYAEWQEKLEKDLAATVERVKAVAEAAPAPGL